MEFNQGRFRAVKASQAELSLASGFHIFRDGEMFGEDSHLHSGCQRPVIDLDFKFRLLI